MTIEDLAKQVAENSKKLDQHLEEISKNATGINNNSQQIQQNSYALEILKDYKDENNKLFCVFRYIAIAFAIVFVLWVATLWFLISTLKDIGTIEEITTTTQDVSQENENGNNNFIGNDGDING